MWLTSFSIAIKSRELFYPLVKPCLVRTKVGVTSAHDPNRRVNNAQSGSAVEWLHTRPIDNRL